MERNDIDDLFKDGLSDPNIPFNEGDWLAMEQRLSAKERKRPVIIWISAVTGIAAVLAIVLFWLFPADLPVTKRPELVKTKNIPEKTDQTPGNNPSANKTVLNELPRKQESTGVRINQEAQSGHLYLPGHSDSDIKLTDRNSDKAGNEAMPLLNSSDIRSEHVIARNDQPVYSSSFTNLTDPVIETGKKQVKSITTKRPLIALGILAGPDITGVQSAGEGSLSANAGLQINVSASKRVSFTTGIVYSKKYYNTSFDLYRPNSSYVFWNTPSKVRADCDVLDIPLNINYKFFEKRKNALSVTTGLSSYFMLKEKYKFSYAQSTGTQGPEQYEVYNQNQHILGIANAGIIFQHQVNSKMNIGVQPFVKLPLTEIGYGRTKLVSGGIAVSLNINMLRKN